MEISYKKIFHRLLYDALFLAVIMLTGAIVVELILPGYLSTTLPLFLFALPVVVILFAASFAQSQLGKFPVGSLKFQKKTQTSLIALSALLFVVTIILTSLRFTITTIFLLIVAFAYIAYTLLAASREEN